VALNYDKFDVKMTTINGGTLQADMFLFTSTVDAPPTSWGQIKNLYR